jgi:diguanylate cyclase (GGDEF)-like protein/PAS domain S-box-containing protein
MIDRYKYIVNASRDFITLINRDYVYEFVNESYCREMNLPSEEIVGKTVADIWGQEKFAERIKRIIDECFQGKESHDIDRFKFGDAFKYIHVSYYPYVVDGEITHVMIYSHDISMIKNLESRLIDYEFKDSTTGLMNRKSLDIVFDMELEKAKRSSSDRIRALLFINLSGFSDINANHGVEVGDIILETTGIRVREVLRASDLTFRFEGTTFAAILTTIKRSTDLPIVLDKIHDHVAVPYHMKGHEIRVETNIGVSLAPDDGDDRETIVKNAISAMKDAKERNERFVIFNRDLHLRSIEKAKIKTEIRKALLEEQFELYFQPIVGPDRRIIGAEALIRWNHPELGLVPPGNFIPIAEESEDIKLIGRWVLFQVCSFLKTWSERPETFYISLNLSAKEFEDEEFIELISAITEKVGTIKPGSLKLEITETLSMKNIEETIRKMDHLKLFGLDVMVDDFGSGYSSLAYLKRLPAGVIKVDRAFVENIVESRDERDFLKGMIDMIKSRGKEVLVEGVSDKAHFETLKSLACDMMQGFYFSKPVKAEEFDLMLADDRPLPR